MVLVLHSRVLFWKNFNMPSSISYTLFTIFSTLLTTSNGAFCEKYTEGIVIKRLEKTTHLHFYFHDIVGGKNPTTVRIAGPPNGTAYSFGSTVMIDDPLTEGPEPTSKLVGRAQGMYAIASQQDASLLMVMNFAFMEGTYIGSSISILGRNPVMDDVREIPIVGGSGLFRSAHGYALAHTIAFDFKTGDAIVEYNVHVTYY